MCVAILLHMMWWRWHSFQKIAQKEKSLFRRWFTDDDYWDIYVWTNTNNEIVGVQICYNRGFNEKALTWFRDESFDHKTVNPSYLSKHRRASPVLMPDGYFDNDKILQKFLKDSVDIDKKLTDFIALKIKEFKN